MPTDQKTKVQVLNREIGLASFTTPTGRVLGVVNSRVNPALWEITFVDGKPFSMADELSGCYTKKTLAEEVLLRYLTRFWDQSDKAA